MSDPEQSKSNVRALSRQGERGASGSSFQTHAGGQAQCQTSSRAGAVVSFNRRELTEILQLYGRQVAAGEWRDYALDFTPHRAVFSIFRRASEAPLYRVEKNPALARKQGAYSVVAATGAILRRGNDLGRVINVLEKKLRLVRP